MGFTDYCILACFTIIGLNMLATGIRLKKQDIDYQGRPPIQPLLYKTGKVASFGVWLLFVLAALRPQLMEALPGLLFPSNEALGWIAVLLSVQRYI